MRGLEVTMTKTGRNDPCPCGSGQKFKKCCEKPKTRKILSASVLSSSAEGKLSSLFKSNLYTADKTAISSIVGKVSTSENSSITQETR